MEGGGPVRGGGEDGDRDSPGSGTSTNTNTTTTPTKRPTLQQRRAAAARTKDGKQGTPVPPTKEQLRDYYAKVLADSNRNEDLGDTSLVLQKLSLSPAPSPAPSASPAQPPQQQQSNKPRIRITNSKVSFAATPTRERSRERATRTSDDEEGEGLGFDDDEHEHTGSDGGSGSTGGLWSGPPTADSLEIPSPSESDPGGLRPPPPLQGRLARGNRPAMLSLSGMSSSSSSSPAHRSKLSAEDSKSRSSNDESSEQTTSEGSAMSPEVRMTLEPPRFGFGAAAGGADDGDALSDSGASSSTPKHLRRKLSPMLTPLRIGRNVHAASTSSSVTSGQSPTSVAAAFSAMNSNGNGGTPPSAGRLTLKKPARLKPLRIDSIASDSFVAQRAEELVDEEAAAAAVNAASILEEEAAAAGAAGAGDTGYQSFGDSDDEKSVAATYSESIRGSQSFSGSRSQTGTVKRTPSMQLRRRKSMAEKKLLIPLKGQPTFLPGTYDPNNIPMPNPMDLSEDSLETIASLGYGNSGVVTLVRHKETGTLMAKKVVSLQLDRPRHLRHMHRAMLILALNKSPYLIGFYGCFLSQQPDANLTFAEAAICLEFMDLGNVEEAVPILKAQETGSNKLDEDFVRVVAKAVVGAMEYLYEGFRAVHRDIKPANVLLNSKGEAKLADLGELGTLGDEGYAQSFVGTGVYMAPERIKPPTMGQGYSVQADVWSLGVMIVELISGKHPYDLERRARERMLEEEHEGLSTMASPADLSSGGESSSVSALESGRPASGSGFAAASRSETMSSLGSALSAHDLAHESFASSAVSLLGTDSAGGTSPTFTPATAPAFLERGGAVEHGFVDLVHGDGDEPKKSAASENAIRPPKVSVDPAPPPLMEQPSVFDLLDAIVNGPVPAIPEETEISAQMSSFLARCLDKDPSKRAKPAELAKHPWIKNAQAVLPDAMLQKLLAAREKKGKPY